MTTLTPELATDFEPVDELPAAPAAPLDDIATDFEPLTPEDEYKELQKEGPHAELQFLDDKDARMEELSFDEWKRRDELLSKKGFWDRRIERNFGFAIEALDGMKQTILNAHGEVVKLGSERVEKPMTDLGATWDTMKQIGATAAEAGVLGAVDFTELVTGALGLIGRSVESAVAPAEDQDKVGYQQYKNRLEARQYRAKISKDSAIGSAVGGAQLLVSGDASAAAETQRGFADTRMENVAEIGAMVTPTNPLNLLPVGAGATAQRIGTGAAKAAAITAEKTAQASNFLRRITDVGAGVEALVRKASPGISDASAATARRVGTGMAWTAAGTAGLTSNNDAITGLAAAYTAGRVGLLGLNKTSEFLGTVARAAAQGPRLQSTLKRVARDPGVPEWASRTAAVLEKGGLTEVVRLGRAATAGATVGGAVSGAFTAAGGGDEREIVGAIATGAAPGGLLGMVGDSLSRGRGGDREMRINTERLLLAEAQRDIGGEAAAKLFYDLPEADQMAIGTIQAIMGPAAQLEVVNQEQFGERTGGKISAGVWIDPNAQNGIGSVLINADAARKKGVTALHEFAHSLTMMEAPDEITTAVRDAIKPEELKAFEDDYLDRVVASMRRRGEMRDPNVATEYDDMGFPVRDATTARDIEGDRSKARKKLVEEVGDDWLEHEFWAEKGAEMLAGSDIMKMAETGEWEPRAARELRLQQGVLRSAGVQFNADGSPVNGEFMGKALSESGEMALGQLLAKYVRDLADYSPRLDAEAKKIADMDAGKGPAINFGKKNAGLASHPAFAKSWEPVAGGGRQNEFAKVSADGEVTLKSPGEIRMEEMKRDATLEQLFPRRGPKADRADPRVMRRDRDGGGEEVSGTVMPKEFFTAPAFGEQSKARVKTLQEIMNKPDGETTGMWYHQIGSGSSGTWAAAVRAKLGNVRSSRREVRPISFLVTQAGNLGVRVLDIMAMKAKSRDWNSADKLGLWSGNLDSFNKDLKSMMANWAQGLPGETGLGSAKHAALLDFLGKDDSKGGLIKTFRVDRMEDVAPTGRGGFTFDYGKFKRRQSSREQQQRPRMRETQDDELRGERMGSLATGEGPVLTKSDLNKNNLPTVDEVKAAISSDKISKVGAPVAPGTQVGLRLDIPAFERTLKNPVRGDGKPTFVVAVHEKWAGSEGGRAGTPISYLPAARIAGPLRFMVNEKAAAAIKDGKPKATIATVEGKWTKNQSIPSDIDTWTQVGMNPRRHSYFYDREMGQPVIGGSEAISIGNTVFVKDAEFGKRGDMLFSPDDIDEGVARHSLMTERGERAKSKFGVLSPAETEALSAGVASVGGRMADKARKALAEGGQNAKETQKLKDTIRRFTTKAGLEELSKQARDIKAAHPPKAGWAKLELVGIDNQTGDLKWQQIPYSFERSPDGKLLSPGTPEYTRRVETLSNRMRDAVGVVYDRAQAGDSAAKKIISQASWYKAMRTRLRREFGGLGDLFADLLGATSPNTPVRTNWDFSVEALQGATNGDFDLLMPAWEEWVRKVEAKETELRAFIEPLLGTTTKKALKTNEEYKRLLAEVKEARDLPDELLPRRGGKKFGFNGQNAVRAMVDLWRVVKDPDDLMAIGGTAPKAQNFSGNLIGFKDRATIDVWAGRLLQRMAGFNRIPSSAEGGISGNVLSDGRTTLQFGFGQDVFRRSAELIRNDPTLSTDPKLARIGEDDLQAVVWFLEKEEWTRNNWTNAAGEGGSFEFEADVAGIMDRARLKELRRIADSRKSSEAAKAAALAEINQMSREVDRYAGGLSIQQAEGTQGVDYIPDNPAQAQALQRLHNAVYATAKKDSVIGSKTASTLGRYGSDERSFDVEIIARDGYDPAPLWDEMKAIAREAKQDSTFLARILRDDEQPDPLFHRPGVEIFFQSSKSGEGMKRALETLDQMGAGFHTVIVDGRRNQLSRSGEMPAAVGVRIFRLPEFDARYGDDSWAGMSDEQILAKMVEARKGLDDLADTLMMENPDVSAAVVSDFEVRTEFIHEYPDRQEGPGSARQSGRVGGAAWKGRSVRDAVEAAGRRSGEESGPAGDGGVP